MHYASSVRLPLRIVIASVITVWMLGPAIDARGAGAEWAGPEAAALREMLEGSGGRREAWTAPPELVVLSSVLQYSTTDLTAEHVATDKTLPAGDVEALVDDLTAALTVFTGGRAAAFSGVRTEAVMPGQPVKLLRKGQIVVARFDGFQAKSGTLGYGGRMMRRGAIAAGAIMLDRDFDQQSKSRALLRTHELGHALGYNHVQSRRSVMNPTVGVDVTAFDRQAVEVAYADFGFITPAVASAGR